MTPPSQSDKQPWIPLIQWYLWSGKALLGLVFVPKLSFLDRFPEQQKFSANDSEIKMLLQELSCMQWNKMQELKFYLDVQTLSNFLLHYMYVVFKVIYLQWFFISCDSTSVLFLSVHATMK